VDNSVDEIAIRLFARGYDRYYRTKAVNKLFAKLPRRGCEIASSSAALQREERRLSGAWEPGDSPAPRPARFSTAASPGGVAKSSTDRSELLND
jgi:hypothetical protein